MLIQASENAKDIEFTDFFFFFFTDLCWRFVSWILYFSEK